jgi:hypothetical protein
MKSDSNLYFIVTMMDGTPVCKSDGAIMQFKDTVSCRYNAKTRTFATKTRHHSRALTKDQYFRAQKEWNIDGTISMETLGWKWD